MQARLMGVDFTCAPTRRKPITVAQGRRTAPGEVTLEQIELLHHLADFEALLARPGPWLGGFDLPFGLPREFVEAQALGARCAEVITELQRRCPTRMDFRALVDAWGNGRPAGQRLIHRRTDTAMPGISSSSPLQTRYVPVGFMYYEGLSRLVRAGVTLPRLHVGDPTRVAVEAYPGLLAFELIGRRSYKNDDSAERQAAREDIVAALESGRTRLGLRLQVQAALRQGLTDDASGDRLDAVLALMQAAWAEGREHAGLPPDTDAVEGWIVSA